MSTIYRPTMNARLVLAKATSGSKAVSSWIQLAMAGTWKGHASGEFSFDSEVFAEIVENFQRSKNHEVPLDFEHGSEEREGGVYQKGAPAQGWIKELRHTDDALEGRVEWVEGQPGLGYVRDGSYKFVSPAVVFESVDRVTGKSIGAELVSAALTNRPFLDGMRALAARADLAAPPTSATFPGAAPGTVSLTPRRSDSTMSIVSALTGKSVPSTADLATKLRAILGLSVETSDDGIVTCVMGLRDDHAKAVEARDSYGRQLHTLRAPKSPKQGGEVPDLTALLDGKPTDGNGQFFALAAKIEAEEKCDKATAMRRAHERVLDFGR